MITAKQARENSYDKTLSWCSKKLQPEVELALSRNEKRASKLFLGHEVDAKSLQATLEQLGFKVDIVNMTERAGLSKLHTTVYSVTVFW